jgi:ATP-dependent DNA helicase RecQ
LLNAGTMNGNDTRKIRRTLREVFGLEKLRPAQREVIAQILAGEDVLALMPTGAGKSLCYQLPALHLEGMTVVVSPLISLMKDQSEKLEET